MSEQPKTYGPTRLPVRAELAVFRADPADGRLEVLLRQREVEPFRGGWTLPGEFLREGEDLGGAARRGASLLGVTEDAPIEQVLADARPGRDPRGHVVSVVHTLLLADRPTRSAPDARWFDVLELPPLGFAHDALLGAALQSLRERAASTPLLFAILPDEFTLTELQALTESVLGHPLDRRNFRRKLAEAGFLSAVRGQRREGRHRPAQLYRFRPDAFLRWTGRFRGRVFLG